jgi:hypothetical protein
MLPGDGGDEKRVCPRVHWQRVREALGEDRPIGRLEGDRQHLRAFNGDGHCERKLGEEQGKTENAKRF